jgi:protein AroM
LTVLKIGFVTIGQSPRTDIIPELTQDLPTNVEIVQAGALDDLTMDEVARLAPRKGDYTLVTRMRDGSDVTIARKQIVPLVQKRLDEMSQGRVGAVALLCTGEFAVLKSKIPLLEPDRLLDGVVPGIMRKGLLGVLVPSSSQLIQVKKRWSKFGLRPHVEPANPYKDLSEIENAAARLAEVNPSLIVMDCMGYSKRMKEIVREHTQKPIVLARSILAKIIAELV